jgi:FkbM family methyltransferase
LLLLDFEALLLKHQISIDHILHVGAHTGQEAESYEKVGASEVTWVEANPAVVPALRQHVEPLGHRVITALTSDRSGDTVDFYITNNEQSSSILRLGTHRYEHPEVVVTESIPLVTTTLDDLCESAGIGSPNLLVLDVQGAELLVLRGAERVVAGTDCILAEVNERPLYEGTALLPEFDSYLAARGFDRVATALTIHGWGDALYVRRKAEVSGTTENVPVPLERGYAVARALRLRIGSKAREIVSGAIGTRFDALESQLDQLTRQASIIEQMLVRNELEVAALRQLVDECLDYMQIQHALLHDALNQMRSIPEPGEGQ